MVGATTFGAQPHIRLLLHRNSSCSVHPGRVAAAMRWLSDFLALAAPNSGAPVDNFRLFWGRCCLLLPSCAHASVVDVLSGWHFTHRLALTFADAVASAGVARHDHSSYDRSGLLACVRSWLRSLEELYNALLQYARRANSQCRKPGVV